MICDIWCVLINRRVYVHSILFGRRLELPITLFLEFDIEGEISGSPNVITTLKSVRTPQRELVRDFAIDRFGAGFVQLYKIYYDLHKNILFFIYKNLGRGHRGRDL